MSDATTDIVIAALTMLGFALFALAMFGVALRYGPRRGTWNQPAAAFMAPGGRMRVSLYVLAAAHVLGGIGIAIFAPGGGVAIMVVLLVMAGFYVLCARSLDVAERMQRRRSR